MDFLLPEQHFALLQLEQAFREHTNDTNSAQMTKYMKGKFVFLGIKAPLRMQLAKSFLNETKHWNKESIQEAVLHLYQLPEREFHYLAIDLLIKRIKRFDYSDRLFGEQLITTYSWWDTVDSIASNFFGHILKEKVQQGDYEYVRYLMRHDDMWLNRVSIIFQLKYKDLHREDFLFETIVYHKDSKEFFIQKAAGWALRQYSKFNPQSVKTFIESHELAKLTIREGRKYL